MWVWGCMWVKDRLRQKNRQTDRHTDAIKDTHTHTHRERERERESLHLRTEVETKVLIRRRDILSDRARKQEDRQKGKETEGR